MTMLMSSFDKQYREATARVERDLFIEQIRANPTLTLAELAKMATSRGLKHLMTSVTLGEVLGQPTGKLKVGTKGTPPSHKDSGQPAAKPKEVETRTPAGREAYDAAVLGALGKLGGPQPVEAVCKSAGGTTMQARASLNRLIEAGNVTWTGKARGTRYAIVK